MVPQPIDITQYNKSDPSKVVYSISENDFQNPKETLRALAENPNRFRNKNEDYRLILTQSQNNSFLNYLQTQTWFLESFGNHEDADYLLAFSYGEGVEVNSEMARKIEKIARQNRAIQIAAQWEIVDILVKKNPSISGTIQRIELNPGKTYITTGELIDKFILKYKSPQKTRIFIVAQAWHAPRCIALCKSRKLDVTGGEFVDQFPERDPQDWVRNAFNWVLKEGTK